VNLRPCQAALLTTALLPRLLVFLIFGFGSCATVAWSSDGNFLTAEKLYQAKQFTQAERFYSEVNSESSNFPVAQLRLGTIYYLTERPALAEKCFSTYLKFKESPEVYCLLAGAQFNLRKFDLATNSAQRALQLDPKSAKAFTVLGMIRTAENDFAGAEAQYREALKLNANDSDTWFMLGRMLFLRDDFAEAAKAFERSLKINPQVRTYDNLALTKDIEGDLKGAEECYMEGLRAGQTQNLLDPHIYVGYGEFLLKLNRLAESESIVKEGLRSAPRNAQLHYELSKVYLRMDNFNEAAEEGETAISLGGPDTKVDFLLAQIYTAMGNPEAASKHASRAAQGTTHRER
jgi:tetratricopeptide (TPR) repeat protein